MDDQKEEKQKKIRKRKQTLKQTNNNKNCKIAMNTHKSEHPKREKTRKIIRKALFLNNKISLIKQINLNYYITE